MVHKKETNAAGKASFACVSVGNMTCMAGQPRAHTRAHTHTAGSRRGANLRRTGDRCRALPSAPSLDSYHARLFFILTALFLFSGFRLCFCCVPVCCFSLCVCVTSYFNINLKTTRNKWGKWEASRGSDINYCHIVAPGVGSLLGHGAIQPQN